MVAADGRGAWVHYMVMATMACTMVACSSGGGGTTVIVVTATPGPPTLSPLPSQTFTPTHTSTPIPTSTPIATVTATYSATPTSSASPQPSPTFTPTFTPSPTLTATPTETPLLGPALTAFEIADPSGTFNLSVGTDAQGRPIFQRQATSGFIVFVEGRPGSTRLPVGELTYFAKPNDPNAQPDLQILSSRPLGDGSSAVCDNSLPALGGIPASDPVNFGPIQSITDAMNDFGCRFRVFDETDLACTQDSGGNFLFRNASSTIQFCTLVSDALTFLPGDTILSARLRDTSGNAGPPMEMVVRIPSE